MRPRTVFQRSRAQAGFNNSARPAATSLCVKRPGGDREMAEILALVLHHDEQAVLCAVEMAVNDGAPTKTHVLNLLHRLVDGKSPDIAKVEAPQALALAKEPQADVERYDALREPSTVGDVIDAFRHHFGGPMTKITLPAWLLTFGTTCADLAGRLGWAPPIRSTALAEMRRGVVGDPVPWINATGIEPVSLQGALIALPTSIQERWFARLYLAKALVIGTLAIFWIASGTIALTFGFGAAASVFIDHGFNSDLARALVISTSMLDIAIGGIIAIRRFCRSGLLAGIAVSLSYLASATILTPALWADPLGPLVKIAPAVMLMIVAMAILEDR